MALMTRLAALEDHDLDMVEPVSEAENLAEATEVESSLIEAQENDEEIGDMETDVEVADDAMDAMESLIESLEEAVERGGMDRHEAKLYNLHRKHIYKTLGYTLESHQMVSTEAFDGTSSRLQMTKIALEEEKSTFKKWWEAIVRFIKQMAAKVTDFVVGLFSTYQAIQGRAQSLLKAAKDKDAKYDGKLTKDQQKKYGKIFRGPGFEDNVGSLQEVLAGVSHQVDIINNSDLLKLVIKTADNGARLLQEVEKKVMEARKDGGQRAVGRVQSPTSNNSVLGEPNRGTPIPSDFTGFQFNTIYNDTIVEVTKKVSDFVDDAATQKKVADAWGKDKLDGEHKYGILMKCYDGRAVVTHIGDQSLGDGDDKQTIKKLDLGFIDIGKFKEEDSKLFTDNHTGDLGTATKILDEIIKLSQRLKKASENIKNFNKEYQKHVDNMEKFTKSIPQHAMSFCRKVGDGVKSIFTTSRAMSQWLKYAASMIKDIMNVISIKLSNAPGDDGDKKEEKKDDKKDDGDKKEESK